VWERRADLRSLTSIGIKIFLFFRGVHTNSKYKLFNNYVLFEPK
jgi:hypothetical protein